MLAKFWCWLWGHKKRVLKIKLNDISASDLRLVKITFVNKKTCPRCGKLLTQQKGKTK